MTGRKRFLVAAAAITGGLGGAGVIHGMAQVITDPTGNVCVDTGTQGCSASYVAVSEGGSASGGREAVVSGTGNASCTSCEYAVSGTGNAGMSGYGTYPGGIAAISGTGCASGGVWATVVLSGNCDADSYYWSNSCYPSCVMENGFTAVNLGQGCARGGNLVNFAVWGCADSSSWFPGYGLVSASVFGPASGGATTNVSGTGAASGPSSTAGGCEGFEVIVSVTSTASCQSRNTVTPTNVVIGNGGASNGDIAISGTGNSSASTVAISGTGYAQACGGGPEPIAFSAGALVSYPGAGANSSCY